MTEHPQATILRAIADGKEVEYKLWIENEWTSSRGKHINPIDHPGLEWRIKPEPKPDVVWYRAVFYNNTNNTFTASYDSLNKLIKSCLVLDEPILKFMRNGETGKLKVEVLE